jgi:hypothetical protein
VTIQLAAVTTVAGGGNALPNAAPTVLTDGVATFGDLSFNINGNYLLVERLVFYTAGGTTERLGSSQTISRGIVVSGRQAGRDN